MVMDLFNSYNNINIFLERPEDEFEPTGRFQNQQESLEMDKKIKGILDDNHIPYHTVTVGKEAVREIIEILKK